MSDKVSVDLYVRPTFQDAQVARREIEKVRSNLCGFLIFLINGYDEHPKVIKLPMQAHLQTILIYYIQL